MKTRLWLAAAVLPVMALAAGGADREVAATIVSTDATGNTLTIKSEDGATTVANVESSASEALGSLHSGDKVVVTMREGANGSPASVTAISKATK